MQHTVPPDPKKVSGAADTVKEYLRDKMTRRKREFGRQRWKDCMDFLKFAMPRKEFEDYCRQINRARDMVDPNHEDYGNTAQFWCADCAVRIFVRLSENRGEYYLYWPRFSGNMTEHDASKMCTEN